MEESLAQIIKSEFNIKDNDIRTYSPLVLAYIGDGVFDLIIRTIVVETGNTSVNKLHHKTSQMVKAASQAKMLDDIYAYLTEEEQEICKRGRNAKSHTMAKNATVQEYRHATGFECLIGYLYLTNRMERILKLIQIGLREGEQ